MNPATTIEPAAEADDDRMIRRREVERMTGLSRAAIYNQMRIGTFPEARRIGAGPYGAVAWSLREVRTWMETRERTGLAPHRKAARDRAAASTTAPEAAA